MPFYEDKRACRGCGRIGLTLATCPFCIWCVFCKRKGHFVADCRKVPPCARCHEKGHKTKDCPSNQSSKEHSANPLQPHANEEPKRKAKNQALEEYKRKRGGALNITVESPAHDDDEVWLSIPPSIRDDVEVQPTLVFPTSFGDLCEGVLEDILSGQLLGSSELPYTRAVNDHGGTRQVAQQLQSVVRPEILSLQGKEVTRAALDRVRSIQDNDDAWDEPIGYLDYLTDDRAYLYFRCYAGQCVVADRRIISQHAQAILQQSYETLHYYLLWVGNGHRRANFIRLWSFKQDEDDKDCSQYPDSQGEDNTEEADFDSTRYSWQNVQSNILEAVFCEAFSTHHGLCRHDIENVPGREQREPHRFGLNVMSPLVQRHGNMLTNLERVISIGAVGKSPDSQIAYWATFRPQQKEAKRKCNLEWSTTPQYKCDSEAALKEALGEDMLRVFQSTRSSRTSTPASLSEHDSSLTPIPFIGTVSAKIAFILDFASFAPDQIEQTSVIYEDDVPQQLKACGFSKTNCLLFTWNFEPFSTLTSSLRSSSAKPPADWLRMLLRKSQAEVVLLCGARAENILRPLSCLGDRKMLTLRGQRFYFYVEEQTRLAFQRLYLCCPHLSMSGGSFNSLDSIRLTEAVKFAVNLTGLRDIRPYFIEASTILCWILNRSRREREGKIQKMTSGNINPLISAWLARKGFVGEDIREMERLAGSLTRGLLAMLHALNKLAHSRTEHTPFNRIRGESLGPRVRVHQPFDPETHEAIEALVTKVLAPREVLIKKHLTNKPEEEAELEDLIVPGTISDDVSNLSGETLSGLRAWRNHGYHPGREYAYSLPSLWPEVRRVEIGRCPIDLHYGADIPARAVYVSIEISDPGIRHSRIYATAASDEDPASRLALRCRYTNSSGDDVITYHTNPNKAPVFRANSFVDVLLNHTSDENLRQTPRRYFNENGGKYTTSLGKF